MKICQAPACTNKATRKGLCNRHYMKEYRRKQKSLPTYEDGLEQGRQQAIDAIDSVLRPHQGSCRVWQDTVHLTIQGQTLKVRLDV